MLIVNLTGYVEELALAVAGQFVLGYSFEISCLISYKSIFCMNRILRRFFLVHVARSDHCILGAMIPLECLLTQVCNFRLSTSASKDL